MSHFIVRYTVEDSFILGVACDVTKWGAARKLESLSRDLQRRPSIENIYMYRVMYVAVH